VAKKRSQKERDVEVLHQELLRVSSLLLASFQGLNAQQESELRRLIQGVGAKYRVVKNTLAARAAQDTPAAELLKGLKGPKSIAYTSGDPVALAKALHKYAKENPSFAFQAGLVEGRVVSVAELQTLAALPGREELFARLLGLLQAPAQRLVGLLSAPGGQLARVLDQAEKKKKFKEAN